MNFKECYGDKYRISREEGAEANDPAGFIIPCKRGHIYVHGRELLGVATKGRGPIVKQLLALTVKPGGRGTRGFTLCAHRPIRYDGLMRALSSVG